MRELEQLLLEHHPVVLRVIGEWWEVDVEGLTRTAAAARLAARIGALDLVQELQYMQPEEAAAVRALAEAGGRMPVAVFGRLYGEIRQMGPGRLEQEEPWLDPANPAEALWYCGLLYQRFEEVGNELTSFCLLPAVLSRQLVADAAPSAEKRHLAEPQPDWWIEKPQAWTTAPLDAADDLATLLALAWRDGLDPEALDPILPHLRQKSAERCHLLLHLAGTAGLLRQTAEGLRPTRAAADWLKAGREAQLRTLADTWQQSHWSELHHLPALRCEGATWQNDPSATRQAFLALLPRDTRWLRMERFVAHVRETAPDFQRPDGNYDTWYIRDTADNRWLRGFESWDAVEGRLIAWYFHGPLHWLGLAEWGEGAVRLTERAIAWLAGEAPPAAETFLPVMVQPDGTVLAPEQASRHVRFQLLRVAEPEPVEPDKPYRYRLTPRSLERAVAQGIPANRLMAFLVEAGGNRPIPPGVQRAIERWLENGTEARLDQLVVLRVQQPDLLEKLRRNPTTRPFIGESLGDLAVVIRNTDYRQLQEAAARLGLLIDW
jgi:hypothetical protein